VRLATTKRSETVTRTWTEKKRTNERTAEQADCHAAGDVRRTELAKCSRGSLPEQFVAIAATAADAGVHVRLFTVPRHAETRRDQASRQIGRRRRPGIGRHLNDHHSSVVAAAAEAGTEDRPHAFDNRIDHSTLTSDILVITNGCIVGGLAR